MKLRQARLVTFKSQNLVSDRAGYWDLGSLGPESLFLTNTYAEDRAGAG